MNKNWGFVFLLLLVVSVFNFVSAADSIQQTSQQIDALGNKIDSNIQQLDNAINNPVQTKEQLRKEFLTKAWFGSEGIIAKNPYLGPFYAGYTKISPYTDPIFKSVVGLTPSFSWLFFLALFISITLIEYFYRFYEVLRDYSTFSSNTSMVISLCVFVILIILKFFAILSITLANLIINAVSLLTTWWMQLIAVFVIFFGLIFAGKYSKQIEVFARYLKMKKKQAKEEERKMRADFATRKVEMYGEALDKAFK
jgi:predicted PurR-regulated permease PerM